MIKTTLSILACSAIFAAVCAAFLYSGYRHGHLHGKYMCAVRGNVTDLIRRPPACNRITAKESIAEYEKTISNLMKQIDELYARHDALAQKYCEKVPGAKCVIAMANSHSLLKDRDEKIN